MNSTRPTTDGIEPPYTSDSGGPQGGDAYIFGVGFFCIVVILISVTYTSHICKRSPPPPPPPPAFTFRTTVYDDADNHRLVRFSGGIEDDVLVTFPTFLYSDDVIASKGFVIDPSCSICLVDYKPADVVRLLPACGHLYHVSCIDTWLKAHSSCPMCRNSPVLGPDGV